MTQDTLGLMDKKISIPVKIGNKTYYIGCDRYNFIFGQKEYMTNYTTKKKYLGFTQDSTFYTSLESLMVSVHKRKIKNMKASTINELQNNIIKAKEEIMGLYAEIAEGEFE